MLAAWCAPAEERLDLGAVASRYIRLARDLTRHDPSLIDHWLVPPVEEDAPRRPVGVLQLEADALARELETAVPLAGGADRWRAERLQEQVRALRLAARRLLGESLPFDAEARLAFGFDRARADLFAADRAREALERTLPGSGSLADRVEQFRAGFRVSDTDAPAVMRAALAACRDAVREEVPLPADESVDVTFVAALPWDAHARYTISHRTAIEVNGSVPLDLTRALHLACHEGYAGHHVQHLWTADELLDRRGWSEHAFVPGFGPALLRAEGAAEAGTALAMPPERRLPVYRKLLQAATGVRGVTDEDLRRLIAVEEAQARLEPLAGDIASDYLDSRITASDATERLRGEMLMPDAEAFLFFIERRRSRVLAYPEGRRVVSERLGAHPLIALRELFVPPGP